MSNSKALNKWLTVVAFATGALMAVTEGADAMGLKPMVMELEVAGARSHTQFQVQNTSRAPLPVEITYQSLRYTEAGEIKTSKASDDLVILPVTALIPPGSSQTFRIQWVGNPDIETSRSYMVTARQLPVRMKQDGRARVQVVHAFGAILNVAPLRGASSLQLLSASPSKLANGRPAVAITVRNEGNKHALLANSTLRVGAQVLRPEQILGVVGAGVVGARTQRRFIVPLERQASGRIQLDYQAQR